MWRWLRSWFAWRFSLRRLVVATVFLGAVVGLNAQKIGPIMMFDSIGHCWGWPLPCDFEGLRPTLANMPAIRRYLSSPPGEVASRQLPWTHQTYRLLNLDSPRTVDRFPLCVIIDALFALVPFALILFLQLSRRKVAAKVFRTGLLKDLPGVSDYEDGVRELEKHAFLITGRICLEALAGNRLSRYGSLRPSEHPW